MIQEANTIQLNKPQKRFVYYLWAGLITFATSIWGRATGKSFVIALLIDYIVKMMPRSVWGIQGATFQQLLTRTLPETLDALRSLGYVRDIHYVINRRPPLNWELPFRAPLTWDNFITFYSKDGCIGFKLLSQDREGSSRGPSLDGLIADESLTLNPERFQKEATATNRGNLFKWLTPIHHGIFHFTSMPHGLDGQWLLDHGNYYEQEHGYYFRSLMNERIRLQLEFLKEQDSKSKLLIYKDLEQFDIAASGSQIRFFAHKMNLYSEANAFDNLLHVGLNYLQTEYDKAIDKTLFAVEYLNFKRSTIEKAFYPGLDRSIHSYKGDYNYSYLDNMDFDFQQIKKATCQQDKDLHPDLPLELGLDFGTINWVVVGQHHKVQHRFNVINSFYVQLPKLIEHVAQEFCNYYSSHKTRKVNLHPDNAGFKQDGKSPMTAIQTFVAVLKKNNWQVDIKRRAERNPYHNDKHLLWAAILDATKRKDNRVYPFIFININNCKELFFAMENTPALDDNGKVAKDKRSENTTSTEKEVFATHSTDAVDYIVWDLFKHLLPTHRSNMVPVF